MATGEVLEDVTVRETFETALEAFDIARFRERQRADRERGIYRGLGICNVVESTTYGSAFFKAAGIPGSGYEAAWVKVEPSGAVNASIGLMASGQGYETTFAQVVADALGVAPEDVRLTIGNTDTAPYGMGSRGARGGTAGGRRADAGRPGVAREGAGASPPHCWASTAAASCAWRGGRSSGGSAASGPGPGSASPISPTSPISIRCGCRPAWSRVWRRTRPTTRRR